LDATNPSPLATYLWQNGSTNPTFTVTQGGTYAVTVDNGLCSSTKAVIIGIDSLPKFSIIGKRTICPGETILLTTGSAQNYSYLWQNGSTNPTLLINGSGNYYVDVTNGCGTIRKSVTVENGVCQLYMPTAFTPNNDNRNDTYRPGGGDNVNTFSMEIFNRWGQRVYITYDANKGWNGNYNGKDQPMGNYVYQVSYIENKTGKEEKLRGSFLLIR
jgi:gliding motility-associated-like protein